MQKRKAIMKTRERGMALFFSIFALLLLTAIAVALVFVSNTDTSVNGTRQDGPR